MTQRSQPAFRFYNTRAILTYKTHLPKEVYATWAKSDLKADEVHIAHEMGDTEITYEHTHVLLEWGKAFQTRNARRFDYEGIHPNIKPITTREHLENAYRYLCKEDHSCDYLLLKKSSAFSKKVWSCASLTEALETCEKPADVLGTMTMYKMKPREEYRVELRTPRPWQSVVLDILAGEPNDREILWIYDKHGGAGKSYLCKHLMTNRLAYCVTTLGSCKDIAQVLRGAIDEGWDLRTIIVDLPREAEEKHIYEPLEMMKNGMITSQKYEGKTLIWKPGHVVVMANFAPNERMMTADRWRVMVIE